MGQDALNISTINDLLVQVSLRMTFALAAIALAISNMANAIAEDLIGQVSVIVLSHFSQNRVVLLVWRPSAKS
jgi:hypothetical protein